MWRRHYFSAQLQWHEIDFHQVDTHTYTFTQWHFASRIDLEIDAISQIQIKIQF